MNLTNDHVRKYTPLVRSIVRRYCRGQVEDGIQAVWLRLTSEFRKYDGRIPLDAYVAQHATWAAIDVARTSYHNLIPVDGTEFVAKCTISKDEAATDVTTLLALVGPEEREHLVKRVGMEIPPRASNKSHSSKLVKRYLEKIREIAGIGVASEP